MRLVVDTNVLVSGLLTPFGTCGDIVRLIVSGTITLCVDGRILFEYEAVLKRPRFKFSHNQVNTFISYLNTTAEKHCPPPLSQTLPDPDDLPFIEEAVFAKVNALITGNLKHFPEQCCYGIPIVSPRDFIEQWRQTKDPDHDR